MKTQIIRIPTSVPDVPFRSEKVTNLSLTDKLSSLLLIVALSMLSFLCILLAEEVSIDTSNHLRILIVVEAVMISLIGFAPLVIRWLRGQPVDVVEPSVIVAAIYFISFTLRPLLILSPGVTYIQEVPYEVFNLLRLSDTSMALSLTYSLIGLIFFQIGYFNFKKVYTSRLFNRIRRNQQLKVSREWSSKRVSIIAFFGAVGMILSAILIQPAVGSIANVLDNFGRLRGQLMGYGYQGLGLDLLNVLVLLLWADHLKTKRRWIFLLFLLASNSYNIVIGSRASVFNLWFSMFLLYRFVSGRTISRKGYVIGIVVLVLAIVFTTATQDIRNNGMKDWSDIPKTISSMWENKQIGILGASMMIEFDQFDIFSQVIEAGENQFPMLWGKSYTGLAYQAIPRSFFKEKPWPYDVDIGYYITGLRTAIPPGFAGELYMNFHLPGIALGMFLLGFFFRMFYNRLTERRTEVRYLVIYSLLLPYVVVLLNRSFVGAVSTMLIYSIPAVLAVKFICGKKSALTAGSSDLLNNRNLNQYNPEMKESCLNYS